MPARAEPAHDVRFPTGSFALMTRIKDDTPILEGDVALSLREERKRRGLDPIIAFH